MTAIKILMCILKVGHSSQRPVKHIAQERGSLSAKEDAASIGHILGVLTALLKVVTLSPQWETLKAAQPT